jgi:hypothetical protein
MIIVDLISITDPDVSTFIDDFATEKAADVIRISHHFSGATSAKILEVPSVFGPYYGFGPDPEDCVNRHHFAQGPDNCSSNAVFVSSVDVADALLKLIERFRDSAHSRNNVSHDSRNVSMVNTSRRENNLSPMKWAGRVHTEREVLDGDFRRLHELARTLVPDVARPYVSHVTTVSDLPRVVQGYQIGMKTINELLKKFPLISIEFICVFCPSTNISFDEIFHVPKLLRRYLKIVFISPRLQARILHKHGHFFPEYLLRNIGLRRAAGTYKFCGSSDILMPPGIFMAAERRLLSPLSYVRSLRTDGNAAEFLADVERNLRAHFHWVNFDAGYEFAAHALIEDACGDFQGAHWRKEVFHVDSAIGMDMNTFLVPMLVRFFPGERHIPHVKISRLTPHLGRSSRSERC